MKITHSHWAYWQARTTPRPKWTRKLAGVDESTTVHWLINLQVPDPLKAQGAHAMNTARMVRNRVNNDRVSLVDALSYYAQGHMDGISDPRRGPRCAKWLRRVAQGARA